MRNTKEILTSIGMTDNESKVYMVLIDHEQITSSQVSIKTNLHRQVVYDILNRLLSKNFITEINLNSKKYYKALNPTNLLRFIEEKKDYINLILPGLISKYEEKKLETGVEFVKGDFVVKNIYNDIFETLKNTGETLYIMGVEEESFLKYDEMALKQHFGRMKNHDFYEKILTLKTKEEYFDSEYTKYAYLPENLFNPNPIHIYKDKVAIIVWGNPIYGILIKNEEFAQSNKKYFEVLWDLAEKRKN